MLVVDVTSGLPAPAPAAAASLPLRTTPLKLTLSSIRCFWSYFFPTTEKQLLHALCVPFHCSARWGQWAITVPQTECSPASESSSAEYTSLSL